MVIFYKKFKIELHYKIIFNQIRLVLSRPICWEAVNRIHFSSEYKISSYSTPILVANVDLFIFHVGDSDQNYLFFVSPPSTPKQEEDKESKEKKRNTYFNTYGVEENNNYLYI